MDEIFDRLKAIKIPRKYLVAGLIFSEILGILVLIWFLRTPLTQKFLTSAPKAYSVVSMNPKKQYLVKQGDFLIGNAIPNSEVKILISPGNTRGKLYSDKDGKWSYRLPQDLESGKYRFIVANIDKSGQIAFAKGYRINLKTNSRFNLPQFLKTAKALDGGPGTSYDWQRKIGDDWADWLYQFNKQGIYPGLDDSGEIVYYGRDTYAEEFCADYSCVIEVQRPEQAIAELESSEKLFSDLYVALKLDGWPKESFIDYFPYWDQYLKENSPSYNFDPVPQTAYKHYGKKISEDELADYVNKIAIKNGYPEKSSQLKYLMNIDPLFGSRAIYNIVNGYQLTNSEDYVDAFLTVVSFVPELRAGGKAALRSFSASVDYVKSLNQWNQTRRLLKEGAVISQKEIDESSVRYSVGRNPHSNSSLPLSGVLTSGSYPISESRFFKDIEPYIFTKAWPLEPSTTQQYANKLVQFLIKIQNVSGKTFSLGEYAVNVMKETVVYVLDDDLYREIANAHSVASTNGNFIMVKRSLYQSDDWSNTLIHELVHSLNSGSATGFRYSGTSEKDRILTGFYELMTELITEIVASSSDPNYLFGRSFNQSFYRVEFKDLYQQFFDRLMYLNPLYPYDFMEFAITGSADRLVNNISDSPEFKKFILENRLSNLSLDEQFVRFIKDDRGVNPNGITYLGGTGLGVYTYPAVEFNDFFVDIKNGSETNNYSIQIISSNVINNSAINIASIVSANGEVIEEAKLVTRWYIEDVYQNRTFIEQKTEGCALGCEITLPSGLNGFFSLIVELTDSNNEEILASTSTPIEIPRNPSLESAALPAPETEAQPLSSSLSCSYTEWSDVEPYSCQDGWACYNDWYLDEGTSCQPSSKDPHYHCVQTALCLNPTEGDATRPGD